MHASKQRALAGDAVPARLTCSAAVRVAMALGPREVALARSPCLARRRDTESATVSHNSLKKLTKPGAKGIATHGVRRTVAVAPEAVTWTVKRWVDEL